MGIVGMKGTKATKHDPSLCAVDNAYLTVIRGNRVTENHRVD